MEVKREELVKMLNGLKPAIPAKGDEDMTKRVVFTGTDAVAYSESMCIVWPFKTDFRTVAPSDEIIQILGRMSADTVKLVYSKDCLNINAGKIKSRIKTEPTSPVLEEVDALLAATETEWIILPDEFLEAMGLCMYTTSKDTTQRALMCVLINAHDIISSDDFRISHYKLPAPVNHQMLIPQAACVEIVKHRVSTYAVTDTWNMFNADDHGNVMVASRVIKEEYAPVEQFFEFDGTPYTLPKTMKEHIDTVSVMAEGDWDIEKEITVKMEAGKILMHSERDLGWVKAEIKDDDSQITAPATFNINPDFLKEILARTQDMKLGKDKGLFEKGTFRHLVSLTMV